MAERNWAASALGVAAALALCAGATAQVTPGGTRAVNWERMTVNIVNGATASVVARNQTINVADGNTARVLLTVDGVTRGDKTEDSAAASVAYDLTGDGPHVVQAECFETRSDASACTITIARSKDDAVTVGN